MDDEKPLFWLGSTLDRLRDFPDEVKDVMGYALQIAQWGSKYPDAKPLRGFKGASVLEIVDNFDGNTYRAVYTVRFKEAIYVLHVFQKKSKHGIKTSKQDLELIRDRLSIAQTNYKEFIARL